jgi:DNA mismatch repair protein MutH
MDRLVAISRLNELVGKDLRQLAEELDISVKGPSGKINKGWAGHVCERYLGLPLNSSRAPNFGSWELKSTSLKRLKSGQLVPKETLAITMLDPFNVAATAFEDSHLLLKLQKILLVGRVWVDRSEPSSLLYGCASFDLADSELFESVKADYDLIRSLVIDGKPLSGRYGRLIQARTKGPGHGSTSRAFYARKAFVSAVFNL